MHLKYYVSYTLGESLPHKMAPTPLLKFYRLPLSVVIWSLLYANTWAWDIRKIYCGLTLWRTFLAKPSATNIPHSLAFRQGHGFLSRVLCSKMGHACLFFLITGQRASGRATLDSDQLHCLPRGRLSISTYHSDKTTNPQKSLYLPFVTCCPHQSYRNRASGFASDLRHRWRNPCVY